MPRNVATRTGARRVRQIALLLSCLCAASLSAAVEKVSAQDYVRLVNRYTKQGLQADSRGVRMEVESSTAPSNWWEVRLVGEGLYTFKNSSTGQYLAGVDDHVVQIDTTGDNGTKWRIKFKDQHWRLSVGSVAGMPDGAPVDSLTPVLDHSEADSPLTLNQSRSDNWSSQWHLAWDDMPDFAFSLLDEIVDWTEADTATAKRDELLLAAHALINTPETPRGLALKASWAAHFPYDAPLGDRNSGDTVVISGGPLDRANQGYSAQTSALFSTGFYAAPGEEITVGVPASFVAKQAFLRIGHLDEARTTNKPFIRFPFSLAVERPIDQETVTLTNGFGGVVYIGGKAGFDPDDVRIVVQGGTRMPVFRLGVTRLEDWRREIRHFQAPWAEISSKSLATTLPASSIRFLEQPDDLARYWERVVAHQDRFVGIESRRTAQDRINFDMGMPPNVGAWAPHRSVTAPLSWQEAYLEPGELDWWGWYHELGHNHQAPAWARIGKTAEVSNNIVLLNAHHEMHGSNFDRALESWSPLIPGVFFAEVLRHFWLDPPQRSLTWTEESKPEDAKLWAKLTMFAWLGEAFGWNAFEQAFRAYQEPGFMFPENDQEQMETLMVQLSRATGQSLAPYFELWGQPLDTMATRQLAGLPEWKPSPTMSIGFGIRQHLAKGETHTDSLGVVTSLSDAFNFQLRDLRFRLEDGTYAGNVLWKAGGGPVTFDLQFDPFCLDCEGPNQIIVGIKGQDADGALVWSGKQSFSSWNGWTGTLAVPETPGIYEIGVYSTDAQNPNEVLEAGRILKFRDADTIGFVLVSKP